MQEEYKMPKLTELQEFTEGDKLTMIAEGQVPLKGTTLLTRSPIMSALDNVLNNLKGTGGKEIKR